MSDSSEETTPTEKASPTKIPVEAVKQFLGERAFDERVKSDTIKVMSEEEYNDTKEQTKKEDDTEKVKLPSESALNGELNNPHDINPIVDYKDIEVTENEKLLFCKAMMNDVPFTLPIKLLGGHMVLEFRAKSSVAQKVLFNITHKIAHENNELFAANTIDRLQRFTMVHTLVAVNGEPFDFVEIDDKEPLDTLQQKLETAVLDKLPKNEAKWNLFMKGMNIFTAKQTKLLEQCYNQDFWTPLD